MADASVNIYLTHCAQRGDVLPVFPNLLRDGETVPFDLARSEILRFGANNDDKLVIEYLPADRSAVHRLILGFNECGIWVEKTELVNPTNATQGVTQKSETGGRG